MKINKLVKKLKKPGNIKKNWKKHLSCSSLLLVLCIPGITIPGITLANKLLSGECYNGYKKVVKVYDPANPSSDTLTDSVGVDHAADWIWRVPTACFDSGTVVNIEFLDSIGTVKTRTKKELEFLNPFGDYASTAYWSDSAPTHCAYGEIETPDSLDPYGTTVFAYKLDTKDSVSLPVDIRERIDDYHGDVQNWLNAQEGDSIILRAFKYHNSALYEDIDTFEIKKAWQPANGYMIDATKRDFYLQPNTAVEENKGLEKKIKYQVYPVPSTKKIYIKRPEDATVKVFDLSGKYVADVTDKNWGFKDKQGNNIKKGIYFFEINHKGKKEVRKGIYLGNK